MGQVVAKMITILSFMVGTSKNKNLHYRVKEAFAIMSAQVTYDTDHITLLCDSTMASAPNFCFLCILL